jgi:hypothetical protein
MSDRIGDWIQTYSGRCFWPLSPSADEVDIGDIAHSLSLQCRYNGHCKVFYSVAEHSVLVSKYVAPEHALWGLLHDAPEAYTSDIPRPLKRCLPEWKVMENRIMEAICDKFGMLYAEPEQVSYIDMAITSDERTELMNPCDQDWGVLPPAIGITIPRWSPYEAEMAFLRRFLELSPV